MRFFVGIDWATQAHAVCILDQTGRVRWQGSVPHTADGLADLLARLRRVRRRGPLRVALERPSGLLVDTLVDAGFQVVPIHPNALKASRPRYSAAGGTSDPGDAFILADLLRTDGHRFRPLHAPSDETRALRTLVRGRDDLVAQRVAVTTQLRALLERCWPGAGAIFADVDSPIALAFLSRSPTPHSAARLGEQRLAQFLRRYAYCGRRPVGELLARLRSVPVSQVGEADAEASGEVVHALVAVLTPLVTHLQQLSAGIEAALSQHPDGPLLQSLPRSGAVNAAQILAELGDDRARFPTDEQLAAEGGLAPVTHASGQHHAVVFRWACNKRLRRALTTFADNSRHASRWAALVYQRARGRGCRHQHAVRILARAWV
jgi:transposase